MIVIHVMKDRVVERHEFKLAGLAKGFKQLAISLGYSIVEEQQCK